MHFERNNLKDYAEPVSAKILQVGTVYFSVQFADYEMLIPIVQPWIFLGPNLSAEKRGLYFQDFGSHSRGIRFSSARKNQRHFFQIASPQGINHIFEFERALDMLILCALRRKGS